MEAFGSFDRSSSAETSAPWSAAISLNFAKAAPEAMIFFRMPVASSTVAAFLPSTSISAVRAIVMFMRSSSAYLPCRHSMDSMISSALPAVRPSGWFMSVRSATMPLFMALPTRTMDWARAVASATVRMKAPVPHLTSSTSESMPSAIFLHMIEAVIKGIEATVPVTSRRA